MSWEEGGGGVSTPKQTRVDLDSKMALVRYFSQQTGHIATVICVVDGQDVCEESGPLSVYLWDQRPGILSRGTNLEEFGPCSNLIDVGEDLIECEILGTKSSKNIK